MNGFSLGDLAQTYMLQRRGAALKADMGRITQELATGQVSDAKSVLAGNIDYFTSMENDLNGLAGYRVAISEVAQFADAAQTVLDRVGARVGDLSAKYLSIASNSFGPVLDQFSTEAALELDTIVGALNTTTGGRSIFAGRATDQPALQSAETILGELRIATAGATDADSLMQAAELWFDDPNGFATLAYTGSDDALAPFRLGDDETVEMALTANNSAFRDVLLQVSVAAISNDPGYNLSTEDRQALLRDTGQRLFQAQDGVTGARASVGFLQARVDAVSTQNSTQEFALMSARNALLQVDPYEAATELEAVQFQLQSLYAITARMSDMSFVNYIR